MAFVLFRRFFARFAPDATMKNSFMAAACSLYAKGYAMFKNDEFIAVRRKIDKQCVVFQKLFLSLYPLMNAIKRETAN